MAENASIQERLENYLAEEEEEEEVQEPVKREMPKKEAVQEEPEAVQEEPEVEEVEEEIEEIQIASIFDLRNNIEDLKELTDEELYSITVPVTDADNKVKHVPIGEWKDSYQSSEKLKAEKAKIAQEREYLETEIAQKKKALDSSFYTAAKVLETAEKAITGSLDDGQLRNLRESDPAEYAAIKADYKERLSHLDTLKKQLAEEYEGLSKKQADEFSALREQERMKAMQALPQFLPEWQDESVARKEAPEIVKHGVSLGFTEQELLNIVDPRAIKVLRDSMMYSKLQSKAPETKKKIVSIGKKVLSSGKSKTKVERQSDEYKSDYTNWRKKGGDLKGAANLIEKHLLKDF